MKLSKAGMVVAIVMFGTSLVAGTDDDYKLNEDDQNQRQGTVMWNLLDSGVRSSLVAIMTRQGRTTPPPQAQPPQGMNRPDGEQHVTREDENPSGAADNQQPGKTGAREGEGQSGAGDQKQLISGDQSGKEEWSRSSERLPKEGSSSDGKKDKPEECGLSTGAIKGSAKPSRGGPTLPSFERMFSYNPADFVPTDEDNPKTSESAPNRPTRLSLNSSIFSNVGGPQEEKGIAQDVGSGDGEEVTENGRTQDVPTAGDRPTQQELRGTAVVDNAPTARCNLCSIQ